MKRLSAMDTGDPKRAAISEYLAFIEFHESEEAIGNCDDYESNLGGDPSYEFARGFFVGFGLSSREAAEAAEAVCDRF